MGFYDSLFLVGIASLFLIGVGQAVGSLALLAVAGIAGWGACLLGFVAMTRYLNTPIKSSDEA